MALALAEVPHRTGGVQAAMAYLTDAARGAFECTPKLAPIAAGLGIH